MIERAFTGTRAYWSWMAALAVLVAVGGLCYIRQAQIGLAVTGLGRDISWGLYSAQFTFFVGVAASAVTVVLPYYLHDYRAFARITILGEFLAIGSVVTCMLFVLVDLGQPARLLNVVLHPSPKSMMFWDVVALGGYLALNVAITRAVLPAEAAGVEPPRWVRPVIVLSIPWAVSIHTVTAFLYSGLAGRSFWLTALLAPRFLATAFASGPALLMLAAMVLRRVTRFDPGRDAIARLATIVTYATIASVFFMAVEAFTVFYSQLPHHVEPFLHAYDGAGGAGLLLSVWISIALALLALVIFLVPPLRRDERKLTAAAAMVFLSIWFEKGFAFLAAGFVVSPLGLVSQYSPTMAEVGITVGIWALCAGMVTVFFKIVAAVREDVPA